MHFIVPFNTKYRIRGIYPAIGDFLSHEPDNASYLEIFPEFISRIKVDQNFVEACPPYLKPKLKVEQPPSYLLTVNNGRIISDLLGRNIAYISADNHLIGEISFQWYQDKILPPEQNKILKYRYFEEPKKFKGTVFSMLSGAAGAFNYFHWFADTYPKLYLAQKAKILDSIDWFLVPGYNYRFQKEYLAFFDIYEDRIIRGNEIHHLIADKLVVPSATRGKSQHIPEWIPEFYQLDIMPKVDINNVSEKRIYISRNDSKKRRVLNEQELVPVLKKYGFEIHSLNKLSTEDQIKLFASANFIITPHGAGLANLVYCQRGTKVLEFFPGGYVKHTFYDLSNKCGLDYQYLICEKNEEASNAVDGQKIHIKVNVQSIEHQIIKMLQKKESKAVKL